MEGAGIHHRSCHRARARHRREHRGLQSRPHDVVRAARLRAAARSRAGFFAGQKEPENLSRLFLSDLSRHPRAEQRFHRRDGLQPGHGRARAKRRHAPRLRRHRDLELFLRARRSARAGSRVFAGRGNSRPRGAGRDRQLRLLGETFPRSDVARLAIAHQRPPLHDRRHRAARIHRPDAGFLAGSLAAARSLRSGGERFCEREQHEAWRSRGDSSCSSSAGSSRA